MRTTLKNNKVTWVNLENPTQEESRALVDEFGIDTHVADELLSPSLRPKLDLGEDYIYLILHFPSATSPHADDITTKHLEEVDFIIGKDFIITAHYAPSREIGELMKVYEVETILNKDTKNHHAGFVFHTIIHQFYRQMNNRIEVVRDFMNDAESRIFKGEERQMVEELSRINRILLTFKEALGSHQAVLGSFESAGKNFFGEKFAFHLHRIIAEYTQVLHNVETAKEYVYDLRETNDSLLSTKQNDVMQRLTVMAFVILPLSLIASIFGMNAKHMPFIGQADDFLIILFIMLSLTLAMFVYFKSKKWL